MRSREKKDELLEQIMGMRKRRVVPDLYYVPFVNRFIKYKRIEFKDEKKIRNKISSVWNLKMVDEDITHDFAQWEKELMSQRKLQIKEK